MARQSDLFPNAPRSPATPSPPVEIELHFHDHSALAWFLSRTGMERDARWVPKSVAERSERFPRIFTMPRDVALQKGFM